MPVEEIEITKAVSHGAKRAVTRSDINALVNFLDCKNELVRRVAGISTEYKIVVASRARLELLSEVTKAPIRRTAGGWGINYRGCIFEWQTADGVYA